MLLHKLYVDIAIAKVDGTLVRLKLSDLAPTPVSCYTVNMSFTGYGSNGPRIR